MGASRDLETLARSGDRFGYPAKAGVRLFRGTFAALTLAGLCVPAGTAGAVAIAGVVESHVDNREGADGDLHVEAQRGCFGVVFAATFADIGRQVFAVDDQSLSFDGSGGRLLVGTVAGIGDGRTWIDIPLATKDLAVATVRVATLVGADVTRTIAAVKGRIVRLRSVIDGVLTTGDATITAAINGVEVTDGVITITQAGSAAGDVDEAVPTALNEVEPGDVISLTVGGTNATATPATVVVEIAQ
ncbi:hypothetical protein [Mesorhizobium sp. 1M-11]|uniref:hypothetical protein n=1 Tax=Mesorhizobium sp. 1M-11 TaxID=1529006 RepID=UPI0006C764B6|nr:hypothetical protein [Mesorhizobium sp. 1M-11]